MASVSVCAPGGVWNLYSYKYLPIFAPIMAQLHRGGPQLLCTLCWGSKPAEPAEKAHTWLNWKPCTLAETPPPPTHTHEEQHLNRTLQTHSAPPGSSFSAAPRWIISFLQGAAPTPTHPLPYTRSHTPSAPSPGVTTYRAQKKLQAPYLPTHQTHQRHVCTCFPPPPRTASPPAVGVEHRCTEWYPAPPLPSPSLPSPFLSLHQSLFCPGIEHCPSPPVTWQDLHPCFATS